MLTTTWRRWWWRRKRIETPRRAKVRARRAMRGVTGRKRLIRKNLLYLMKMTAGASVPELPPMKRMEVIRKRKIVTETKIENKNGLVIARRIGTIEIWIEKKIASKSWFRNLNT